MTGAYAIVRLDLSGPAADAHIAALKALAADRDIELVSGGVLLTQSESGFCLLLAALDFDAAEIVLVPSISHVTGWLDLLRHKTEVWAAMPEQRWSRRCVQPARHCSSVPGPM
ncbi:hypothetical protein [Nocardia vulneris]|uniref:Uncharacterized protein n=1 Tax=Nocardia vulneris TaxID=1141657 RepID=A0ABR4Z704_9NOCA|nr:hypothetical protein [Nocardia vulneris]KIA61120.1 hypothetical protein FG87_32840 [Nocardia vulneris]